MKKKLLLALMALLPLVGWAQATDLSNGWEIVFDPAGPVTYNGTDQTPAVKLKKGDAYLTTGFNVQWSAAEKINAGSYTVTVTADNTNTYDDLAEPSKKFWVLKAVTAQATAGEVLAGPKDYVAAGYDLVTTAPTVNYGTVKYLATNSAVVPAADAEGWSTTIPHVAKPGTYYVYYKVDEEANWAALAPALIGNVVIDGTELQAGAGKDYLAPTAVADFTFDNANHNMINAGTALKNCTMKYKLDDGAWGASVPQAKNAKDHYTVYWKAEGSEGYLDAEGSFDVVIGKGTPELTAPTGKTGLTYNKTQQALLATTGSVTLGATLKYKVNGGDAVDAEAVKGLAAGNYSIVPTVAGTDNTIAKDFDAVVVNIAQKDLYIYVQDKTKVYDGVAFALDEAVIEYNGLIAGDGLTGAVAASYVDAGSANKGVYAVTTTGGDNANYNIHRLTTGKFTITARPITLTAKTQTITFGDPVPGFDVNDTYIDIQAAGEGVGLVAGESATVLGAIESVGLKEAKTDIGTYEGNIVITKKATAAADAPNYEISVVAGTYKINPAGGYTLIAENKTVTYGQAYEFTFIAPNGEPVKDVEFDVYKGEEKLEANPTDWGTYTIKVRPDTYAPANFGGAEAVITYIDGTLTIEKKALKIAPKAQTLRVGKKATDLVASMVEFTGVVAGDEGKIGYTLAFNVGDGEGQIAAAKFTDGDATKALLDAAAGTYNKGIKAVLSGAAEGNRNANYTLDPTSVGELNVVNATSLTFGVNEAADLANLATYNGAEVEVNINFSKRNARTLGGQLRPWKAEEWVVLTLPFDISVSDLSKALGYAIVNVIDPDRTEINGTSSKFYGKLTMKGGNGKNDVLAANKPFLVKTVGDIPSDVDVDFGSRVIVAPGNDEDALSVDAGRGAKFTGTYTTKEVSKTDEAKIWFMLSGFQNWAYVGTSASATWNIVPLEGFIDMKNATSANEIRSMTFFFEEEDGTVTAIESVNAEGANSAASAAAEGWYTINGVKLEAKPTQKGIYIFNGKKVAIQ